MANKAETRAAPDLQKEAELDKEAEDRINAFEFGMDLWFKDNGLEKKAFAEALGIQEDAVTELGITCLEQAMGQVQVAS